jgi:hypothetical protein
MAKLVPAGRFFIEGTPEIDIRLTTHDKKLIRRAQDCMERSSTGVFKICGHPFYIMRIATNSFLSIMSCSINLSPALPMNMTIIGDLKKYGRVEWSITRSPISFDHREYVKHDFEKKVTLSEEKKIFAKIWDILPDKEGNVWEIVIWKEEERYCPDCNDDHIFSEPIHTFKFKNKCLAMNKWKTITRNFNREMKENI